MKTVFVVVTLVLTVTSALTGFKNLPLNALLSKSNTCNMDKMHSCTVDFLADMGVTQFPSSIEDFLEDIDQFISNDPAKVQAYCEYFAKFTSCMDGMMKSCFNAEYLMNTQHWSPTDAYGAVEFVARSEFACEPANLKLFMDNFQCYYNTMRDSAGAFQVCTMTFAKEMQADPSHKCEHAQEFVTCIARPFTVKCNEALGKGVCGETVASLKSVWPDCTDFSC